MSTYTGSIRTCRAIFIVVSHFVEIVFVELPYKARKVAVLEVLGEDVFGKLFVLFLV